VRMGRKPILLIHGEKDSYIPIAQSQALYDLAAGPRSLWIVPGAKHNQSVMVAPEVYAERVLRFLGEYLAVERRAARPTILRASHRPVASPVGASSSAAFEPALRT